MRHFSHPVGCISKWLSKSQVKPSIRKQLIGKMCLCSGGESLCEFSPPSGFSSSTRHPVPLLSCAFLYHRGWKAKSCTFQTPWQLEFWMRIRFHQLVVHSLTGNVERKTRQSTCLCCFWLLQYQQVGKQAISNTLVAYCSARSPASSFTGSKRQF